MKSIKWKRALLGLTTTTALVAVSACGGAGGGGAGSNASSDPNAPVTLNIATVSNPDMTRMQQLVPEFEKTHPNITVKFTTLPENTLRDKLTQDVATKSGAYDLATVGVFEAPIWAKNGWLENVSDRAAADPNYDVNDILQPVRDGLTYNGGMYAVPFYAESSFLMYRKDLFKKAGLTMPAQPTWDQIEGFAQKLNDPTNKVAGICLRGQSGWGSVYGPLLTMAHSYGAHVYDPNYQAGFTSPEFTAAATKYVDMAKNYGEAGASSASFPECLNSFSQGNSAMWYDATVAASTVTDPASSKVADEVGFAPAPSATQNTGGWLWVWSLAMISTSKNKDAAWQFQSWASSKDYIKLVGEKLGPNLIPPGTRTSTYALPEYQKAAGAYADLTLKSIETAKTSIDGAAPDERSFYINQPTWQDCGTTTSQFISEAIAGKTTTADALAKAQDAANSCAKDAGLQK